MRYDMNAGASDHIADILRQYADVKVAWLFGSAARDEALPGSDFDLAILREKSLQAAQKKGLIEHLARSLGRPIGLVDLQAARGPIVGQVLRHGQRLFCDDTTLYAELMKRWMFDQADRIPLRRRILRTRRQAWIEHS